MIKRFLLIALCSLSFCGSPIIAQQCVSNSTKRYLARVDEKDVLRVFDTRTNGIVYSEPNIAQVEWKNEHYLILAKKNNAIETVYIKSQDESNEDMGIRCCSFCIVICCCYCGSLLLK